MRFQQVFHQQSSANNNFKLITACKKLTFIAVVFVSVLLLTSCKPEAQVKELTIFHTNDLHSHLKKNKSDPFELGGLARTSTLLKQLRTAATASLTLDAGDWSEGTWYYDIDQGANMLRLLSAMNYDAAALGNHDFLQGPDELVKTLTSAHASFPVLAANLNFDNFSGGNELSKLLAPSIIKTVDGIKVGIIGLTIGEITYSGYFKPVKITDVLEVAMKRAAELRPQVDVLILLSHNNFSVNKKLAELIPGLDAVLSGHSHVKTTQPVMVKNLGRDIPVLETGSWGKNLGELKISVDMTTHLATFKNYQMHPIEPSITEDSEILSIINEQDLALAAKTHMKLNEIEAETEDVILQSNNAESPLGNLTAQAYRKQTGADVSLEEMSFAGVDLPRGAVTTQDIHDVMPHIYNSKTNKDWTLNVWNAKGSDLYLVMTTFYSIAGLMPLSNPVGWLTADNADIIWDSTAKVPLIKSVKINQKQINPLARYKVAMSEGLLRAITEANTLLKLGLDLSQLTDTGVEAWRALLSHVRAAGGINMKDIEVGRHVKTLAADLAIHYYEMSWDGKNLNMLVHNNGLDDSRDAIVTCYAGVANSAVLFEAFPNDLETWSEIGKVSIGLLHSGGLVAVEIPWSSNGLPRGYLPVKCSVAVDGDGYAGNNDVTRVFQY